MISPLAYAGAAAGTGVAAGVGGQARRDKSEIGAVTWFRYMFHKFGKKFGKFRVPNAAAAASRLRRAG